MPTSNTSSKYVDGFRPVGDHMQSADAQQDAAANRAFRLNAPAEVERICTSISSRAVPRSEVVTLLSTPAPSHNAPTGVRAGDRCG